MIGYVTLGTNDLQKSAKLYDAIAAEMGVGRMMDFESFIALAHGGSDAGAPGPRGEGFYAAYFRDLDGNKLNAFTMG
jgi:predicted lactoylglutathione lyase